MVKWNSFVAISLILRIIYAYFNAVPNTLCHIALQGPLTRAMIPKIPFQWVAVGCIIPDIPWITFRILSKIDAFPLLDLNLYCVIQASLFFCVILSAAFALTMKHSGMIFSVLAGNSLAHLLLDATQIKWGNGVHLFAPLDWKLMNFGWFWPDHWVYLGLTGVGLFYFIWRWKKEFVCCPVWLSLKPLRLLLAVMLLACYFAGPLFFIHQAEGANVHFLHTLKDKKHRTGKTLLIDRERFDVKTQIIYLSAGESFTVEGEVPLESGVYSMKGYFTAPDVFYAVKVYHNGTFRNWASIAGLLLTALFWLTGLYHCRSRQHIREQV